MDEKPLTFYTDRSAAEADDKCGMKFWHNRHAGGKGLVPVETAEALEVGRDVHEDLALIAEMEDISEKAIGKVVDDILEGVVNETLRTYPHKSELLFRRLGWLVAYALYIEPKVREVYENVSTEREIALDRSPLIVGVTPDRTLRHRKGRYLVYREYKSTISSSQKWLNSWKYAIQLHTSLKAIEEETGEKVKFAQVMGLMKGYYSNSDKRLVHPYANAYYNEKTDKWSHDYRSGFEWVPTPVWEYPGGIVEWVKWCGQEVAEKQFPHTEPIFLNEMMVDNWVARRTSREKEVSLVKDLCRDDHSLRAIHFEQRTNQCSPPFGDSCPYLVLCWNASYALHPEKHPDFVERKPHHDLEMIV
jgi:hypothetical protein